MKIFFSSSKKAIFSIFRVAIARNFRSRLGQRKVTSKTVTVCVISVCCLNYIESICFTSLMVFGTLLVILNFISFLFVPYF